MLDLAATPLTDKNCRFRVGNLLGATDTEGVSDFHVLRAIFGQQVCQQLFAESDHCQKTAAGAVIFRIVFQVRGQLEDASAQKSDLNFGAAGVSGFAAVLCDDFAALCFVHNSYSPIFW